MQPELIHPEAAVLDNLAHARAIRLQREKAGKWSAIGITAVVHVIAILILTLIVLPALQVDELPIRATFMEAKPACEYPNATQTTVKSRPKSPSTMPNFINAHSLNAQVFAPTNPMGTSVTDIGIGTMLGLGIGPGGRGYLHSCPAKGEGSDRSVHRTAWGKLPEFRGIGNGFGNSWKISTARAG